MTSQALKNIKVPVACSTLWVVAPRYGPPGVRSDETAEHVVKGPEKVLEHTIADIH